MVNPELIKLYGEDSRPLFAGLIKAVGSDVADKYYVIPDTTIEEHGVRRPRYMSSVSPNIKSAQSAVYDFIYDFTGDDDATGIYIFNREPKDCEVQLCLN